ncbi:MAG: hypothetical protein HOC05_15510, partial [Gemmatimonadetes bacterium]|nr:hypothetical protein [Gemmatimonadota bacterium]
MKRLCLLILLVGCSHDAKRENPLDPELTPAIELTAAIDDTSGTVQLTWEPYDGRAPFAAYWVLRSQPRLSDVDTLATITDVTQLTFTDSLLDGDLEYNYHVSTVNQSGFEVASQEQRIRPLNLPPVQIEALTFDSATASAAISWTPYRGPRFKAYQVLRRTSELAAQVVEEIDDIAKTDFTDTGLRANTEYFYQVVVVTDRDEQIASTELSDALHRLVDTWALPAKSFTPSLRLYFEGGRIVALVDQGAQSGVMHLWTFDTTGQLLSDENFLGFAPASTLALAYARTASGRRLFALGNGGPFATHYGADGRTGDWDFVLVAQEPDGQLLMREHALSTEGFPALVAEAQRQVLGEVVLLLGGKYGRVKIATADRVFFDDDFTDFPADLNGWTTETFPEYRPDASPIVKDWILRLDNPFNDGITSRSDPEWRNFYLETEVIASSEGQQFAPTIQIGGDTFSRYTLKLSLLDQQAELTWLFSPPDDSELEAREVRISEPLPVIDSFSNWLRLGAVDGQVSASVLSPALISDVI